MSFVRTAVIGTNALSQLFGREQPVGFDDGAFAMHPFGFDGIEPGTLFGQKQREKDASELRTETSSSVPACRDKLIITEMFR